MKKKNIILLTIGVLAFGLLLYYNLTMKWHPGPSGIIRFKDIEGAQISKECIEYKDDVCGLFDCTINQCWCDDSSPELPILYEEDGISIADEEEAASHVQRYIDDNNPDYTVEMAMKLNNIFFNVFAENADSDEITFTVAVDGTILKTICGV